MSLGQFRLDGKVALITGGNRGIGLAVAEIFGEAGARSVLTARRDNPQADALLRGAGYEYDFVSADATDPGTPERLVKHTLDKYGRIDILVNNAGIASHGETPEFDDERVEALIATNIVQVFRFSRAALPAMQRQGEGVILNVGSMSGFATNMPQRQVVYNSSKAAVHMMTKSLASEFAARTSASTRSRPAISTRTCRAAVSPIRTGIRSGATGRRWAATAVPKRSPTACCSCVRRPPATSRVRYC